jgi:starvation-inducible DNA-binding protein
MGTLALDRINIGITDKALEGVIDILNRVLSDAHVLYIKTRKYHWNVTGIHFHSLHLLFEQQYTQLAAAIDEIAEHARSRGGKALGTMAEYLQHAKLKEATGYPDAKGMIDGLLQDHEAVIRYLRESIDKCDDEYQDTTTSDFLTGLARDHEKMAWMLRAHLEGK